MKTLIQISNLNKQYGSNVLFEDASVAIFEKQKIGVLGRNGAGKTTLISMILNEISEDSGEIRFSKDLRLSHLKQSNPFEKNQTVMEYLMKHSGKPDWECGRIAGRFYLKNDLLDSQVLELSGGYQMRTKLASMLLTEPNFLILDEPTNYLDLNTLLLLENFLKSYTGGFMVISHDREFLKNTCEQTLEVENGNLFLYPGRLEEYLEFKAAQIMEIERQNKNTEARKKELESFVERFRAKASKASQAQSKLKQLGKLHTIEIDHPMSNVRIRMPDIQVRKGAALVVTDCECGYSEKSILRNIDLNIARGSKSAILGDNGQGKSTLLKTLAGKLAPLSGTFEWKENSIGYYAQHVYTDIPQDLSVIDYLKQNAAPDVYIQQILDLAGSFLFSGEDTKKEIRVLSGGERGRLCLAGLLLGKHDVLLLDEPSNHLDFETVEALALALQGYKGTVLFVSHDRTFVNMIATEIIEIDDGRVQVVPGNYQDYVYRLQQNLDAKDSQSDHHSNGNAASNKVSDYSQKKQARSELKKQQKLLKETENQLDQFQRQKEELLELINTGPFVPENQDNLNKFEINIKSLEEKWIQIQAEIDTLEDKLEN